MWPSFTVRVLQDTDLWMVITQLLSAISVIIASGVVVWISGQKERKAKEKRIEYFLDVVLFLYSQMEACRIYITRRKLSFIEDVVVMELFSSCRKTVERLNSNPLEVTYDCPNPGITRNLLTLALNFDEVARNIDNFKKNPDEKHYEQILKQWITVLKYIRIIAKTYSRKTSWFNKKFRKSPSVYEYINNDLIQKDIADDDEEF